MSTPSTVVLTCDLGGTQLRTALVDAASGRVVQRSAYPTPKDDSGALGRALAAMRDSWSGALPGAVVGVPGLVNYTDGEVVSLPNLPGWRLPITSALLSQELGLPVLLANDADLAALGEQRYGAGRGYDDVVYVTISTGIGAGVVLGGRLLHGQRSLAELGHTIIDWESEATAEGSASGSALARDIGVAAATLAERARAGDEEAIGKFQRVARIFGVAVFNMVRMFSPQIVVVGGGLTRSGDLLWGPLQAAVARQDVYNPPYQPELALAAAGDDVGLLGAAAYWLDNAP
jgi:glucokinase